METIITLSNINRAYRQGKITNPVLTNFSWQFAAGCFTILAGPSGSGKSTLLNILATLDRPDSGEYLFEGRPVCFGNDKSLIALRRQHFGFVFQSFNLIPVLTAMENVTLPLTLFGYSARRQREMGMHVLNLVGLDDKVGQKPGEMSGGEQQRVAIARAIVNRPRIILADEPTANLDRHNAENIISLMKDLNREEGMNFIIASHDDKVILAGREIVRF